MKIFSYIIGFLLIIILAAGAWCACVLSSRSDEDLEESMLDPSDKE